MKEVLMITKPKYSFPLIVSDSSANIQTTSNPPLYLQANGNYELAMANLETYYSFANISDNNNSFKWSAGWPLFFPTGIPGHFQDFQDIFDHFSRTIWHGNRVFCIILLLEMKYPREKGNQYEKCLMGG